MAYRGDLIACEVDFDGATSTRFPVKFFLNGRGIACASMRRTTGQANPFPFIAMGYQGIRVLAKVCSLSDFMSAIPSESERRLYNIVVCHGIHIIPHCA